MLLDVLNAASLVAQTLCWIIATKLLDKRRCISQDVTWKFDGVNSLQDDVVGPHRIGSGEWWSS